MSTIVIGLGMGTVVAEETPRGTHATRSTATAAGVRHRECADFFDEHGISAPGTPFDALSDTCYFTKHRAGRFVRGNREIPGIEGVACDARRAQGVIAPFHEFRTCIAYLLQHLHERVGSDHPARLCRMSLSTSGSWFTPHFSMAPRQYQLSLVTGRATTPARPGSLMGSAS